MMCMQGFSCVLNMAAAWMWSYIHLFRGCIHKQKSHVLSIQTHSEKAFTSTQTISCALGESKLGLHDSKMTEWEMRQQ